MNRLLNLFLLIFAVLFSGCGNDDSGPDQEYDDERDFTEEIRESLTDVTVCSFDIGWTYLQFAVPDQPYTGEVPPRLIFYVDLGKDNKIKQGTIRCKDTNSFKRYAAFKCGNPHYGLTDIVTVKKIEDDLYEISYSYKKNGQTIQGSYRGKVEHHSYAIDYAPHCY